MTDPIEFKRLRETRISDEVASLIRAELASGRLKVGSRLPSERALAEQFGVSRNALREAMRSLEHAGLIRLQKGVHGGAIVQNPSGNAIASSLVDMFNLGVIEPSHLTQARIFYESAIIRLACENITDEGVETLNANIDAAETARAAGDFGARIALHLEFHRILARIAGNPIMVVVMNGVLDIMARFLQTLGPYDNAFVTPSRRRFMAHLTARNAEAAIEEMETLLRRLEKNYLLRASLLRPAAGARQSKTELGAP